MFTSLCDYMKLKGTLRRPTTAFQRGTCIYTYTEFFIGGEGGVAGLGEVYIFFLK